MVDLPPDLVRQLFILEQATVLRTRFGDRTLAFAPGDFVRCNKMQELGLATIYTRGQGLVSTIKPYIHRRLPRVSANPSQQGIPPVEARLVQGSYNGSNLVGI